MFPNLFLPVYVTRKQIQSAGGAVCVIINYLLPFPSWSWRSRPTTIITVIIITYHIDRHRHYCNYKMKKQHNKSSTIQLRVGIVASVFNSFLRHNRAHNPEHKGSIGCMIGGHPVMKEKWLSLSNIWTEMFLQFSGVITIFWLAITNHTCTSYMQYLKKHISVTVDDLGGGASPIRWRLWHLPAPVWFPSIVFGDDFFKNTNLHLYIK